MVKRKGGRKIMVTEKRNPVIEGFIYYRIHLYILSLILIYMFEPQLFDITCLIADLKSYDPLYNPLKVIFNYGIYALWLWLFFTNTRNRRYKHLTGRSYMNDRNSFNWTYPSLVKFYTQRSDTHKLDTSYCPYMDWKDAKGIVFGYDTKGRLLSVESDCESNFLTVGPPGSWKTRGHVMPNCITFDGSIVCVDIKGECGEYSKTHSKRKILRFCPDDEHALEESVRFDIFQNYHNLDPTDQKLFIENVANILVKPEGGEAGTYFTTRGRKIFRGICHYILDESKPNADFPFIIHSILQSNIFTWGETIENSNCTVAKELILSLKDGNDKNMGGAYDTLTTSLLPYSNDILDILLSNKEPNKCVSIKQLDDGYDLFLQIKQEHINVYAPLLALILQEGLMRPFMQRPDSSTGIKLRPILFIIDEFPRISESMPFEIIDTLLATMRSRRVLIDMLIQNIGQLEKIYGQEGAKSIMANCNYQTILSCNDADSANYFSMLFGKKWVLKQSTNKTKNPNNSSSNGISVIEEQEDIYSPQDFCDLPSTKSMVVYFKGKHVKLRKLKAI